MNNERGAVAAMMICCLPALIMCMGLLSDLGVVLWYRFALMDIADLAALAGVQELDLEALAQGEPRIMVEAGKHAALDYARFNIQARLGSEAAQDLRVQVTVYNPTEQEPLIHHRSGRELIHPTICVHLQLPVRTIFAHLFAEASTVTVSGHADAAAVRKER